MSLEKPVVCLIDDDEIYQFIFRKQIEISNLSNKVFISQNGKKGFDYLISTLNDPPSIPSYIFLDINMPIMDGWQFLEKFSSLEANLTKDINIYLVTSSIDQRDKEKATNSQFVKEYLVKPISENKILEIFNNNQNSLSVN